MTPDTPPERAERPANTDIKTSKEASAPTQDAPVVDPPAKPAKKASKSASSAPKASDTPPLTLTGTSSYSADIIERTRAALEEAGHSASHVKAFLGKAEEACKNSLDDLFDVVKQYVRVK